MRYGNQLVTTAVSFDINRVNGVADVLHLKKTFSSVASSAADSRSQAATRCGASCSVCRPGPYR